MEITKKISRLKSLCRNVSKSQQTIALVPTMGYFHDGHLHLMRKAKSIADKTVVSIYVNPTQFGENEDLSTYPSNLTRDNDLAAEEKVDYLFIPENEEIYPPGYQTFVNTEDLSSRLCGLSRPGHFKGVCTVVLKLFNIVRPDFAVFGQKDAQQAIIIKRMVKDLDLDTEILIEPIIREKDGLAMSSRNKYIKPDERPAALSLYSSLTEAERLVSGGETRTEVIKQSITNIISANEISRIDYVSVVDPETLLPLEKIKGSALIALAVYVGSTRLIDNVLVKR